MEFQVTIRTCSILSWSKKQEKVTSCPRSTLNVWCCWPSSLDRVNPSWDRTIIINEQRNNSNALKHLDLDDDGITDHSINMKRVKKDQHQRWGRNVVARLSFSFSLCLFSLSRLLKRSGQEWEKDRCLSRQNVEQRFDVCDNCTFSFLLVNTRSFHLVRSRHANEDVRWTINVFRVWNIDTTTSRTIDVRFASFPCSSFSFERDRTKSIKDNYKRWLWARWSSSPAFVLDGAFIPGRSIVDLHVCVDVLVFSSIDCRLHHFHNDRRDTFFLLLDYVPLMFVFSSSNDCQIDRFVPARNSSFVLFIAALSSIRFIEEKWTVLLLWFEPAPIEQISLKSFCKRSILSINERKRRNLSMTSWL